MPTHSAAYRQRTSAAGGSQSAGSWSALLRWERAVTATSETSAPWSLAYASRRRGGQAEAPLAQAGDGFAQGQGLGSVVELVESVRQ
ncbi:hypothetical protein [Streptomyces sp. NPDC059010]|uniref:hypothetical protein n=1 Tax=Streptomyces sp. NPDC059010 TaxID=3346695 RepID=UPI0036B067D7